MEAQVVIGALRWTSVVPETLVVSALLLFAGGCSVERHSGGIGGSRESDDDVEYFDAPREVVESKSSDRREYTATEETSSRITEGDSGGASCDRIEILADIKDEQDRKAIQVAIDWLKRRGDEPLDVEVKLGRNGGRRSVYFVFVSRSESGEKSYVVGGHCMVEVSESGEVVDVLKGA